MAEDSKAAEVAERPSVDFSKRQTGSPELEGVEHDTKRSEQVIPSPSNIPSTFPFHQTQPPEHIQAVQDTSSMTGNDTLNGATHPLNARSEVAPAPSAHPPSKDHDDADGNTPLPPSLTYSTLNIPSSTPFDRFQSPASVYPTGYTPNWEEAFEAQRLTRLREKIQQDLQGWRGAALGEDGRRISPRSGYSKSAIPTNSYYGEGITGKVGRDLPKEIIRIERDWSGGEVCQFESGFPMELEGRLTPQQWNAFIDSINDQMAQAYSVKGAVIDNVIAIATWWTSLLWRTSHFEKELRKVEQIIESFNETTFNPAGLNVLSPRDLALQFLEIEYY